MKKKKAAPPQHPRAARVHAYARDIVAGRIVAGRYVRAACQRHLDDLAAGSARGLVFHDSKADAWLGFFEEVLYLKPGVRFLLQDFQAFIIGSLFGWYRTDGRRRFRTFYGEMGKGNGKCLALDTPIPTAQGWTTMGAIRPGEILFDERGRRCRVVAVHEVKHGLPCYAVRFSDGAEIIADAEHLWRTWPLRTGTRKTPHKPAGFPRKGEAHLFTTAQLAASVHPPPSLSVHPQARFNHRVEIAGALDCDAATLPLPPYALGVWLGDGNTADARITCQSHPQILDHLRIVGVVAKRRAAKSRAARYLLTLADGRNFQRELRGLGLLGRKHIPAVYQRACLAQRLALLQGLMDTDGHISARHPGSCEYTTTRGELAEGVVELLRGLGFKVRVHCAPCLLYGRRVSDKWRICFTAYSDMVVSSLVAKQGRLPPRPRVRGISQSRHVIAVTPVPSVPVRCIAVDSPSSLFLAGRHLVPTHNTPLNAGLGLGGMTIDKEHAPEVYAFAAAKEQARICFNDARNMVHASPLLSGARGGVRIDVLTNNLSLPRRSAKFGVLSAEDKGHHGLRVHMGLGDEIHAHGSAALIDTIEAGTKNCRNALISLITNSGHDRRSACWHYHTRALEMLRGKPDDDLFAYVCTLDPCPECLARGKEQPDPKCKKCDDWRDPAVWKKANPGLGTVLDTDYLKRRVTLAQKMPSKLNNVLQLNFCLWTETSNGWADMHSWRNLCHDPALRLDQFKGRDCWLGLDAANRIDATCLALIFERQPGSGRLDPAALGPAAREALAESTRPETPGDMGLPAAEPPAIRALAAAGYALFVRTYVPAAMVDNSTQANYEAYQLWKNQGHLTVTDGASTDFARIENDIRELAARFNLRRLQADPRELSYLLQRLQVWAGFEIVQVSQSPAMISQPMKEFEGLVASGLIKHDGNPVLEWMLGNVEQKTTSAGGPVKHYYPRRPTESQKIDAVPAALLALDGALRTDPNSGPSIYETQGLRRW